MPDDGVKNDFSLPDLSRFYFDRVWVKVYQSFFSNLRDPDNFDKYREYRDTGVFEDMTDSAFRLYRTLRLIRDGLARGYSVDDIPKHVDELARYGERDFYEFYSNGEEVVIHVADRKYHFKLSQVKTVKYVEYTKVINDRVYFEKAIYMELAPYLRIMVKPYLSGFVPPLIRLLYNPLIRVKVKLGLGDFGYEHVHDNFIDPDQVDLGKFIELNHRYAFDRGLADRARMLWRMWFNRDEELRIKVSQVEYSYDSKIPKEKLLSGFHFLGGRAKTIKDSYDSKDAYYWVDSGAKYYITIRKGLQVKLYTKAWSAKGVLNRIEFTINLNKDLDAASPSDVYGNEDLVNVYLTLKKTLADDSVYRKIKEILDMFVQCRVNCERHYAFWLDMLLIGQVKGSRYYRHIAEVYRRKGLIKVTGRGRNSAYVINDSYAAFSELRNHVLSLLKINPHELKLRRE